MVTTEHRRNYIAKYNLERYHRRMNEAFEILGGVCIICGSTEDLQLDHFDPRGKLFTIGKFWSYSQERFLEELSKCQLLCAKCHLAKTVTFDQKAILEKKNQQPRTIKKSPRRRAGMLRQNE
jgi:5-methylcytosine-specific restriction endonuclease McrA